MNEDDAKTLEQLKYVADSLDAINLEWNGIVVQKGVNLIERRTAELELLADANVELTAENADLRAEVERLTDELKGYRRSEVANEQAVRLAEIQVKKLRAEVERWKHRPTTTPTVGSLVRWTKRPDWPLMRIDYLFDIRSRTHAFCVWDEGREPHEANFKLAELELVDEGLERDAKGGSA